MIHVKDCYVYCPKWWWQRNHWKIDWNMPNPSEIIISNSASTCSSKRITWQSKNGGFARRVFLGKSQISEVRSGLFLSMVWKQFIESMFRWQVRKAIQYVEKIFVFIQTVTLCTLQNAEDDHAFFAAAFTAEEEPVFRTYSSNRIFCVKWKIGNNEDDRIQAGIQFQVLSQFRETLTMVPAPVSAYVVKTGSSAIQSKN